MLKNAQKTFWLSKAFLKRKWILDMDIMDIIYKMDKMDRRLDGTHYEG